MATKPVRGVLINGFAYSWASVEVRITCESTGKTFDMGKGHFTAINFSRERDHGFGYGPHPDPILKTRGQNKHAASIKFFKAARDYIVRETLGGAGHGDRFFTVDGKYLENGSDTSTFEIKGCTMGSDKTDNAKGTDPTEVEIDLKPMKVIVNGEDDVDDPLAAA